MSNGGYHHIGHRVASVCFTRREAICDCGVVVTVPDDESRLIRDEALAVAFSRHRSAAGRNAGYRGRDRAHIWTPA
jgi:hypothetical protein